LKLFFCHSSSDKPLIREIRSYLSVNIQPWIDEDSLIIGEPLGSIQKVIESKSDFVLIFISKESAISAWVQRELKWALNHEKEIGYPFVLPVVINKDALDSFNELKGRKYLLLSSFEKNNVSKLAMKLDNELSEWAKRQTTTWPPIEKPIPLILAGCGQWARNRTVLPLFMKKKAELFRIVAVTKLLREDDEFRDTVEPSLKEAGIEDVRYFRLPRTAINEFNRKGHLAVAVNTPNSLHAELADAALNAGCHVYAERPVTRQGDDLSNLLRLAGETSRYLYTGTQRRLEFPYRYIRDVLQKGKDFGKLSSIRCS